MSIKTFEQFYTEAVSVEDKIKYLKNELAGIVY